MFDKLNNLITQNSFCTASEDEDIDDEGKSTNCYYYITEEFQKANFKTSTLILTSTSLSIFLLNIHLVQLHIEANKGGTLLYVSKELNYKPREYLELYKSKDLESSFIEIINQKESNDIIGVIYRHPKMDVNNFIDDKLICLLRKIKRYSV